MFFRTDRNIGTPVRKARGALLVAAGLIGLLPLMAACSGNGGKGPEASAAGDTPALTCPKVTIPDETREVTQFRAGGAHDMTDVVSRAAVLKYDGGCEYGDKGVTVNLNLLLGAERVRRLTMPKGRTNILSRLLIRPGRSSVNSGSIRPSASPPMSARVLRSKSWCSRSRWLRLQCRRLWHPGRVPIDPGGTGLQPRSEKKLLRTL